MISRDRPVSIIYVFVFCLIPFYIFPGINYLFGISLPLMVVVSTIFAASIVLFRIYGEGLFWGLTPKKTFLIASIVGLVLGLFGWMYVERKFGHFSVNPPNIFLALLATVVGPVEEELIFRGVLLGTLLKKLNNYLSILIVSVLFVLLHPRIAFVPLLILSIVVSVIRSNRKGVWGSIVCHVFYNLSILMLSLWR